MKTKKLNYDFNIRDIETTKEKHSYQIKQLKKKHKDNMVKILDQLDYNLSFELQSSDLSNPNFTYYGNLMKEFKQDKKQSTLKSIKSYVNLITRLYITSRLEYFDIPKSYDTAFYCIYYNKINKLMKYELKQYIKDFS